MKNNKTWNKTRIQGLVRHKSGGYYARLFIRSKEKWISLKTKSMEVAKAKLGKEQEGVRKAQRAGQQVRMGKMTIADAVKLYKVELEQNVRIKNSTRNFWLWILDSVLCSWPELPTLDVRKVTANDCKAWATQHAQKYSPTYFNNSVVTLSRLFDVAIKMGIIFHNPTVGIQRMRPRAKQLTLPTHEQFQQFVKVIENSFHPTSQASADLVRFLAFSGCRISEAKRIMWKDVDFERNEIVILGDPDTGTKNWQIRRIPMILDCRALLERMKSKRPEELQDSPILLVGDARGSMQKAAKHIGIEPISHHDLRHLFATRCIESGVDIPTVSRWLGHKDGGALAMKTYGHLRDEHSKLAAQKVTFGKMGE